MTQDIGTAFDHPEARAAETADARPRDRISLRDHIVEIEIGAFQAERGRRQRVCFNIVVEVRPGVGPVADDVDRILSYDLITEAIRLEINAGRINLLETLAERIAERILAAPQAMRVFVRVEKLDRGPGALGVEIVRSRDELAADTRAVDAPQPLVVFLSNAAINAPRLAGWIDQIEASVLPVIFCVGLPDGPLPQSQNPAVQRRIDLLAIEQNAWVLAGRDARCVVVGTRTEIDWAMKNGQSIVWAPGKLVLDTAGAPGSLRDPLALCAWFAGLVAARRILVIGDRAPGIDADFHPMENDMIAGI